MQLLRLLVIGALAGSVNAQWGRKKNKEGASAMREEFEAEERLRAEQAAAGSAAGGRDYELENLASAPRRVSTEPWLPRELSVCVPRAQPAAASLRQDTRPASSTRQSLAWRT